MKLKALLKDIPDCVVKGSKDVEITGLSANSKVIAPGYLFVAKKGAADDGNKYIPEALQAGAAAILTDIYNPFVKVTQIIHSSTREVEARLAAQFYQHPSEQLYVVGVTGTNGKTTSSFLYKHILDAIHKPCGLIGTIDWIVKDHHYKATHTTPDVITCQRLLREMVSQGCEAVSMEVASHALDQNRVGCIDFDVAVFTNLTQDHLDYHKTMQDYGHAKARLFTSLKKGHKKSGFPERIAIVNGDDPAHTLMVHSCSVPVMTYGLTEAADVQARNMAFYPDKTTFDVFYQGEIRPFSWGMRGKYNVYNGLGAIAMGLSRGMTLKDVLEILSRFKTVRGRLEAVENPFGLNVFVDYAHTDDALHNVLTTLKEAKRGGRLLLVFGCGGNRDPGKRPKMGRVAAELADQVFVTSDNPRDEKPEDIISQILSGIPDKSSVHVEVDRREAIAAAVKEAGPEDMVLIAGKGHETYQIFSHKTIEFDDVQVAKECMYERFA